MTPSALSVLFGRPSVTSSTASPAEPRSSAPEAPGKRTDFAGALEDAGHGSARTNRPQPNGHSARQEEADGSSDHHGEKSPSAFSSASRAGDAPQDIEGIGTLQSNSSDPAAKTETGADFAPMPRNTPATREMSVEPPASAGPTESGRRGRPATGSGTTPATSGHSPSSTGLAFSHTGTDSLRVVTTTIDAPLTAITVEAPEPVDSGQAGAGQLPSEPATIPVSGPDILEAAPDHTTDSGTPSPAVRTSAADAETALEPAGGKQFTADQTAGLLGPTAATDAPAEGPGPATASDHATQGKEPAGAPAEGQEASHDVHRQAGRRRTLWSAQGQWLGADTPGTTGSALSSGTEGTTGSSVSAGTSRAAVSTGTAGSPVSTGTAGTFANAPVDPSSPIDAQHAGRPQGTGEPVQQRLPLDGLAVAKGLGNSGPQTIGDAAPTQAAPATPASPQASATNPSRLAGLATSASQTVADFPARAPASTDAAPRPSGTPAVVMGAATASTEQPGGNTTSKPTHTPAATTANGTPVAVDVASVAGTSRPAAATGTPVTPAATTTATATATAGAAATATTTAAAHTTAATTGTATLTAATIVAATATAAQATRVPEPTHKASGATTNPAPESNTGADVRVSKSSTGASHAPSTGTAPATEVNDRAPVEKLPSGDHIVARTTKGAAAPAPEATREPAAAARSQAGPDATPGRTDRALPQSPRVGESDTRSAPLTQVKVGDAEANPPPSMSRTPAAAQSASDLKPASTAPAPGKAPGGANNLASTAPGSIEQSAEEPAAIAPRTVSSPSAAREPGTPGDTSNSSSGPPRPLEVELPSESGPTRQPPTDRAHRPASRRGLSFAPAQPETTAAPAQRPVFTIRSLYDARGASAGQGLPSPETAAAVVETTPAGVTQELPERSSEVATALRSADRQEVRESPADAAAKTTGTAASQASAGSSHGFAGNGNQGQQQSQAEQASAVALGAASGPQEAIFEMPSVDPATLDADMTHLFDNRLLEVLDEWFGETAPTATDRALGGGRSRTGTVASAWLKAVRSSIKTESPSKDPSAWKEVTIELEDGLGSVNIRARRDSDQLSLQILTTDPNTGTRLSSATDRLQAELRDRYGAEVDLSFASDGGGQQQETATAGSGSSVGGPGASQGIDSAENTDSESRRGADRVWVG